MSSVICIINNLAYTSFGKIRNQLVKSGNKQFQKQERQNQMKKDRVIPYRIRRSRAQSGSWPILLFGQMSAFLATFLETSTLNL